MAEYISTRDITQQPRTYSEVLLEGLAPDQGLYVPTELPQLDLITLEALSGYDYAQVFEHVKGLFIGSDIDPSVQTQLVRNAYTEEKFPKAEGGNITPLRQVADEFFIQELSLGPTAAFKDMALQPLGQDMQHVLSASGDNLVLLGATSGDTGSAAEAAVKGLGNISLFMLSPEIGMSEFQKAQMGALSGGNIHNISIPGRFDDCQDIVKAIKRDPEFARLGAVNSINWGRIASQVPYYVAGYLQAVEGAIGRPVDFVVPTGNFGNVLAGYLAREMGVPIRRLIVATNENNVVDTLIQTGQYIRPASAQVTTSPSMDITVASNYERLAFDLLEGDPEALRQYMHTFAEMGKVAFEDFGLPNTLLLEMGFDSGTSTAKDRIDAIRWTYARGGGVIDPHTADAVTVARRKNYFGIPMVCMSTALPVKFEPTIKEALGFVPQREPRFKDIEQKLGGFTLLENTPDSVKDHIRTQLSAQ